METPEFMKELGAAGVAFGLAMLGRAAKRAALARGDGKPFWGRDVWYELPIVAVLGIVGLGVAEAINATMLHFLQVPLPMMAAAAIINVVGYLGLPFIDDALAWLKARFGKS